MSEVSARQNLEFTRRTGAGFIRKQTKFTLRDSLSSLRSARLSQGTHGCFLNESSNDEPRCSSRRRREALRGAEVHLPAALRSLSLLLLGEVQLHVRNGGVICKAACVLGHLQVDVAFLAPGR